MKVLLLTLLLVGFTNGIFISCDFFNWNLGDPGTFYTCQVNLVNFYSNVNFITSYNGTHVSGKSSADVEMVFIPEGPSHCTRFNMTTFPRGFSNIFPNLVALDVRGCAYNTFVGDELVEYPNLKYFASFLGNLLRIPGNLFSSNPNVQTINFNSNRIQMVGEGLLDHLQNLTRVYFQKNPCINMYVTSPTLIPSMIEALRSECPDNETSTSTTTTPSYGTTTLTNLPTTPPIGSTTTTLYPPSSPNRCYEECIESFVCSLNRKIIILDGRVRVLEGFETQLEENEELEIRVEELEKENKEMSDKIANLQNDLNALKAKLGIED